MTGWLTALRIARREARRAKGRSILVMALIGLPVLAASFAAVTYDSFRLTPTQQWEREFGAADATVSWQFDSPVEQTPALTYYTGEVARPEPATEAALLDLLPTGSRLVPHQESWIDLRTPAGAASFGTSGIDLADPIFEGRAELLAGRAPADPSEVALTPPAAERLAAGLGDTVRSADGTGAYRVVGLVELSIRLAEQIVFLPGAVPGNPVPSPDHPTWLWAAPEPVTWDEVRRLNESGIVVRSRAAFLDPPPPEELTVADPAAGWDGSALSVGALIGALGLLEVVLLAGPAFAIGARLRQRELALVAATGGTPAHLRRIMLADGMVLGLAGAVAGVGLGTGLALAGQPLLEEHLWQARAGGYRFFPLALAAATGLAVVTGVLAALVPAVNAARQPVVAALAGRRGITRSRKRWLGLGLVMTALGAAATAWGAWEISTTIVVAGLIVGELGLVLCTPSLVGLVARLARFMPLGIRIALRDTARNRAAAAPAISAVMAAVAGGLALGIFLDSDSARWQAQYRPALPEGAAAVQYEWWSERPSGDMGPELLPAEDHPLVRAAVTDAVPTAKVFEVAAPACATSSADEQCIAFAPVPLRNECPAWRVSGELSAADQRAANADARCQNPAFYSTFQVATTVVTDGSDPDLLAVLTGAAGADVAAAAATLRAGGVVVTNPMQVAEGNVTVVAERYRLTGGEPPAAQRRVTAPAHILSSATGPELLFLPPAMLAELDLTSQVVALVAAGGAPGSAEEEALAGALRGIEPALTLYVERGPPGGADPRLLVLAAVAGVVTLGAAGIATGLAAADRQADLATLGAVGASPRVRRLLALSQSGVIAGTGTLLGIAAGAGAALAVLVALNQRQQTWPPTGPYPIEVPWSALAVLLAVPVVAMLGAGLLARSRLPIERRRA